MSGTQTIQSSNAGRDARGVPISYGATEAIDGLERALDAALAFRGDAIGIIDEVLAEHPDFVMGWLFKVGWLTQAMETRIYPDMVAALAEAEKRLTDANDRERGHYAAVKAWVEGDFFGAVQHLSLIHI